MSQREIVLKELKENGSVSRNWCLANYISRLSSIMNKLKAEGIKFTTHQDGRSGDYKYILEK